MSWEATKAVLEHSQASGGELLTLMVLANHADDRGVCYPGIERIAKQTRTSARSVQRHLRAAEERGELEVEYQGSEYGTNRYFLRLPGLVGGDKLSPGGDELSPGGGDKPGPELSPEVKGTISSIDKEILKSSDDAVDLARFVDQTLRKAGAKHPPGLTKTALSSARLLIDKDAVPLDEAKRVFMWAHQDDFWSVNCMSTFALRKHWDRLSKLAGRPRLRSVNDSWAGREDEGGF